MHGVGEIDRTSRHWIQTEVTLAIFHAMHTINMGEKTYVCVDVDL